MKINNIWIYYLFPIVANLLFLPLGLLDTNGNIFLVEILLCTIVIPIYLNFLLCHNVSRFPTYCFILMVMVHLIVTFLGLLIEYLNWGISTGELLRPDSETIHILKLQMVISVIILFIGFIVAYIVKNKSR